MVLMAVFFRACAQSTSKTSLIPWSSYTISLKNRCSSCRLAAVAIILMDSMRWSFDHLHVPLRPARDPQSMLYRYLEGWSVFLGIHSRLYAIPMFGGVRKKWASRRVGEEVGESCLVWYCFSNWIAIVFFDMYIFFETL